MLQMPLWLSVVELVLAALMAWGLSYFVRLDSPKRRGENVPSYWISVVLAPSLAISVVIRTAALLMTGFEPTVWAGQHLPLMIIGVVVLLIVTYILSQDDEE